MFRTHCPRCSQPSAHLLESVSMPAQVDYFRCSGCGHVWTMERGSDEVFTHVTPTWPEESGDAAPPGASRKREVS